MAPAHPSVLISLRHRRAGYGEVRDRLESMVRGCGYRTRFTDDSREALAWTRQEPFTASFLDSEMEHVAGQMIWRVVRSIVGRRLVLMTWERRNDVWFEALQSGVGAVLPLPPEESSVRAALTAVGAEPPGR